MPLTWMVPSLRSRRAPADRRARAQAHRRRFALEQFEDRTLLSTWTGLVNNNWSVAGNWDAGVPSATNPAVISGNVAVTVDIATASARSLTMSGGAALNLDGNALAVNTAGNAVANGLTMNDAGTTLTGGTNGTLSVGGNFTVDAASTFNVNDVTFKGVNSGTVDSSIAFNNVTIAYGGHHVIFAQPLDVNGALTITGYNTITGNINASGSVSTSAPWSSNSSHNGYLTLDGSGPQTLDGNGGVGNLPKVVNAKSANSTLTVTGAITPVNWTQQSGKLAAAGSTTNFRSGYTNIDTGTTSLGNVTVDIGGNHLWVKQLNVGGDLLIQSAQSFQRVNGAPLTGELTVAGNLESRDSSVAGPVAITMVGGATSTITAAPGDFPNGGIIIKKGSWSVRANMTTPLDGPLTIESVYAIDKGAANLGLTGNLVVGNNVTTMTGMGGDATLVFAGGASQTLTTTKDGAGVPGVVIDKSGGSLTLNTAASSNTLRVNGGWVIPNTNGGAVNLAGSAIKFTRGGTVDTTGAGALTFNDVEVAIGSGTLTVGKMVVDGTLTLTSVYYVKGGTITANSHVNTSATNAFSTSGGAIEFAGAGDQTLTATSANRGVPAVVVNKPSGSLILAGPTTINVNGNWTWTKGTVDATGSTVRLTNANTINTGPGNGGMTFNNLEIAIGSNTLGVTNKLGVLGNLTLNSAWAINAAAGAITVGGNLTSTASSVGGTANITMVNSNVASITGGDFPNGGIIINKGSGGKVNASVAQPLDSLLTLQNVGALTGNFQVGKGVTTHMSAYGMAGNADGSPVISFEGAGAQTLTAAAANAWVPGLKFNSAGAGSVTLADNGNVTGANALKVSGGWIAQGNGNVILPTGSNIKLTNGVNRTIDTGNSAGFQNVELDTGSSNTVTIDKMVVNGTLKVSNLGIANGADIEAKGDVITSNNGYGSASGTSSILINGSGNQTLKATAANSRILGIKIAKTGGLLTIADDNVISVTGNWTYTGDGTDVDASASTIKFIGGDKRIQSGDMKFGNVIVAIGSANKMSIVDAFDAAADALYTGTYNKQSGTIIKGQFKLFP